MAAARGGQIPTIRLDQSQRVSYFGWHSGSNFYNLEQKLIILHAGREALARLKAGLTRGEWPG